MLFTLKRLCVSACTAVMMAVAATTSAMAENTVKIGQLEAISGALATYGWMNHQGVNLAVSEINSAGGFEVDGKTYKLELEALDTRGNPQDAVIQLKQLLNSDVKYVFGPFLTNIYNAIAPVADEANGKFLMMGGATSIHAALDEPGRDYLVRTWNWDAGPGGYGNRMVAYLKELGVTKTAMLIQNDAFGRVLSDIYEPIFAENGIELVIERFEPNTRDFTAPLAKLNATGAEFLFPGYTDAVLNDIVRQATENGFFTRFFIVRGSLAAAQRYKDQIEDFIAYVPKFFEEAEKTSENVRQFIAAYEEFYGRDFPYDQAPLCSSSCYDHVYMLVEAMKKAGSVDDVAAIREALLSLTYDGVWTIKYDDRGEAQFDIDIVHMKRGGELSVTNVAP